MKFFAILLALVASAVGAQPIDLPPGPAVRECRSVDCMSPWRNIPPLPEPSVAPAPTVTAVIAPVDATSRGVEYMQICGPGGCWMTKAPVVVVEYPLPPPPNVYWYQPPAYNVPKVVTWGPWQGHGPWGLPSGPPLRRRR